MSAKNTKTFYAPELSPQELRSFEKLRQQSPLEEIALLRILIRRMLRTLNTVKSFPEAIQAVNAISYLTGRLAKLFEVTGSSDAAGSEVTSAYLLTLADSIDELKS